MTRWCIAFKNSQLGLSDDDVSSYDIWGLQFQKKAPPEGKIRFWWHTKKEAEDAWKSRGHDKTHKPWCAIGYEVEDG